MTTPGPDKKLWAERYPVRALFMTLALFFGGGAIGNGLAGWLAPESGVTALSSFLALPAAFMLSLVLWQGFTVMLMLLKAFRGQRPHGPRDVGALQALVDKAWLLVPLPVLFATAAGLIAGLLGEHDFSTTVAAYAGVGLAYGLVCRALGRAGMLPLLED